MDPVIGLGVGGADVARPVFRSIGDDRSVSEELFNFSSLYERGVELWTIV